MDCARRTPRANAEVSGLSGSVHRRRDWPWAFAFNRGAPSDVAPDPLRLLAVIPGRKASADLHF